jgi:hypothetical protein
VGVKAGLLLQLGAFFRVLVDDQLRSEAHAWASRLSPSVWCAILLQAIVSQALSFGCAHITLRQANVPVEA